MNWHIWTTRYRMKLISQRYTAKRLFIKYMESEGTGSPGTVVFVISNGSHLAEVPSAPSMWVMTLIAIRTRSMIGTITIVPSSSLNIETIFDLSVSLLKYYNLF